MTAPKWNEFARLILAKLDDHSAALHSIQKKLDKQKFNPLKTALFASLAGMVGGLVISVVPNKGVLLELILKVLAG